MHNKSREQRAEVEGGERERKRGSDNEVLFVIFGISRSERERDSAMRKNEKEVDESESALICLLKRRSRRRRRCCQVNAPQRSRD